MDLFLLGGKGEAYGPSDEHPEADEVRTTTVPSGELTSIETLQHNANQAGASDFQKFCKWVDRSS